MYVSKTERSLFLVVKHRKGTKFLKTSTVINLKSGTIYKSSKKYNLKREKTANVSAHVVTVINETYAKSKDPKKVSLYNSIRKDLLVLKVTNKKLNIKFI